MKLTIATLAAVAVAVLVTRGCLPELARRAAVRVRNHRGLDVSASGGIAVGLGLLAAGAIARLVVTPITAAGAPFLEDPVPAFSVGAITEVALVAVVFALFGLYADVAARTAESGWRARFDALRRRRATAEAILLTAGVLAGISLLPANSVLTAIAVGAVVALAAQLVAAFGGRPLRALKFAAAWLLLLLVVALGRADATPVPRILVLAAVVAAVWRADAAERISLGASGTHALGAALGVLSLDVFSSTDEGGPWVLLLGLAALMALAIRPGIDLVIDRVPFLRTVDRWGRQPEVEPDLPTAPAD